MINDKVRERKTISNETREEKKGGGTLASPKGKETALEIRTHISLALLNIHLNNEMFSSIKSICAH